jgi:hypothetical protein
VPSYISDNMVRMFLQVAENDLTMKVDSAHDMGCFRFFIDDETRGKKDFLTRLSLYKVKLGVKGRGGFIVNSSFISRTRKNCGARLR